MAGKTGTAQRANPACGCYAGGGYVTTFVGFAPADDPQYVVAVDLERPTSYAEGGEVAAPVFRRHHAVRAHRATASCPPARRGPTSSSTPLTCHDRARLDPARRGRPVRGAPARR